VHGWLYSDTSYILLGMIIQKVAGQSPVTEISRRILAPLGLHGTSFPLTSKQIPAPYAHGYYGPPCPAGWGVRWGRSQVQFVDEATEDGPALDPFFSCCEPRLFAIGNKTRR
jgi:CubicO group peptidase (beta-lactamase class C family)